MNNFNIDDINKETASRAFYNTSFDPDRRGETTRQEYVQHMQDVFNRLSNLAKTEEQKEILNDEMNRYKIGYITRLNAYLYSQARCASPMITGPANFPVERNRKRMNSADNKYRELKEFSEKAIKSIGKKLDNSRNSEQVTNGEYERLKSEFDKYMKWNEGQPLHGYQVPLYTDKIKRSFANGNYEAVKMLLEYIKADQEKRAITHFSNRHSVWKLLDNAAIQAIEENKKTGQEVIKDFSLGQVVRNYDDDRIRIFFNEKPTAEIIQALKRSAWKWSPSKKAWQRKTTANAMYSVKELLKQFDSVEG